MIKNKKYKPYHECVLLTKGFLYNYKGLKRYENPKDHGAH